MATTWEELRTLVTVERAEDKALARADLAPLPLRLMLGFGFMFHGYPKVFTAEGHAGFVSMLEGMGMPAAPFWAWLVGLFEFFGGAALILGVLVVAISLVGVVEMLVAMFAVHLPHGFSFMNVTAMTPAGPVFGMPGYEVNLLYIAGFLTLAVTGAGALSIHQAMRERRQHIEQEG